jgi:hypothetical protein
MRVTKALALAVLLSFAGSLSALTMEMTTDQLAARADVIVTGTVTSLNSGWDDFHATIYTNVTIAPEAFQKGAVDGAVVVRIPGGEIGEIGLFVEDVPTFASGEKVGLYLLRGSEPGTFEVLGNLQGKTTLSKGGKQYYSYSGYHRSPASCDYYVNSTLPSDWVNAIQAGDATWDAAGSAFRLNYQGATGNTGPANDGINVIWSNNLGSGGTIAANYYWYNRRTKIVSENDIIFNNFYAWSTSGESGKMDVQNIITHEMGHCLILNDLYNSYQSEMTMYGYSTYGETKKQTLETGDKDGIKHIYGAGFDRVPGDTRTVTE